MYRKYNLGTGMRGEINMKKTRRFSMTLCAATLVACLLSLVLFMGAAMQVTNSAPEQQIGTETTTESEARI